MTDKEKADVDAVFALTRVGYSVLSAVYAVLDRNMQMVADEILCHAGCSNCCYQLIGLYPAEWSCIEQWIRERERKERREIIGASKSGIGWLGRQNADLDDDALVDIWRDRPCPFLKNERCLIYEVRPHVCRLACSSEPCSRENSRVEVYPELAAPIAAMTGHDPRFRPIVRAGTDLVIVRFMSKSELYSRG